MAVAVGLRLDHYEIIAPLGAGGMGEVYRARDTRLNRDVAIKVLPSEVAHDADRLRRFEQEARATSALNHPNILTVHDFGMHESSPYLVAELLAGEELRAQLNAGALPPKRAIDYAQQIAAGLAAAHERGVIHRDLKPENLFVTNDGRVKILDFGLAKLKPPKQAVDSEASTQKPLTSPGVVMGTVGYMSPEQVRGQEADHRSDIFSFGIILHEMLSGQRTFTGDSAIEVMNAILKEDPPDLSETNAKISPQLEKLVQRCLEKKPERRFQTASDLGFALEALALPSSSGANRTEAVEALATSATPKRGGWRERIAWVVAGVMTLVALAATLTFFRRPSADTETIRLALYPPENATSVDSMVISPDGRCFAFAARIEGQSRLWVRPLNSLTAQPLPGTEGASAPFWSPDSQSLGFFVQGKLKKITYTGGQPATLVETAEGFGGSWNHEGIILFTSGGGLQRVASSGGQTAVVTTLSQTSNALAHRSPSFLPDDRHFLYFVLGSSAEESAIYLGSLDGQAPQRLVTADSKASYAPPGYLLFVRGGSLLAQPFDATKLQLTGEPLPIAERPGSNAVWREAFSVSENGVLVYGASNFRQQYGWFDRTGKPLGMIGSPGSYGYNFKLSPDGTRLATTRRDPQSQNNSVWLFDLRRGAESRFTFGPGREGSAVWSPDGSHLAWNSVREGRFSIYQKASSGAGQEELLTRLANSLPSVTDWSPDGRFLIYHEGDPKTGLDLWLLPLDGERKSFPWLNTQFAETNGYFSPDSKWIAYTSDESGRKAVYVQAFAGGSQAGGGKWPISTKGGDHARWRRDGKELFFVSSDQKLMAVEVEANGTGFDAGVPQELFDLRSIKAVSGAGWALTGDGQKFLFQISQEEANAAPFTVVLNWIADLKK